MTAEKLRLLALFTLSVPFLSIHASAITPFVTDGCSMFFDGDWEDDAKWMECCIRHDYAYWKGGTLSEREQADGDMKACVADLGEESISSVMHFGVRLGGTPYSPMWYRWGYGWPYMRGYAPLTEEERNQVVQQLTARRDLLEEFISNARPPKRAP